jgi:hypothetical protein
MWPDDDRVFWAGWGLAAVAYSIAAVRLVMLFPAIAIDAPGGGVSNAIADASSHFLNVLLLYLAAVAVIAVAFALCVFLAAFVAEVVLGGELSSELPDWVVAVIATVLILALPSVLVAVDARIFPALADRVRRPPNDAAPHEGDFVPARD